MYLIRFLIFIFIIPNSITIENQIKLAFLNGFNVIRCSDNQVQVYEQYEEPLSVLSQILTCDNKKAILHNGYVAFLWNKLEIICPSTDQIHEELHINKGHDAHDVNDNFPNPEGQLSQSVESYKLKVNILNDGEEIVIHSEDQPADESYFQEEFKRRTIYIWFKDHPIICQVQFHGKESNPCLSAINERVDNVNYKCYYTPGADTKPTIGEMRAEFKQVEEAKKPDNTKIYRLNLDRPKISEDDPSNPNENDESNDPSNSDSDEKDHDPKHPSSSNIPNKKKSLLPNKPSKKEKKSNIGKIVGFIIGIVLLLCLIGGIAFYFIRKNGPKLLSSSENIETGNNKIAPVLDQNKSEQLLSNIEGLKNEISTKDKPNITLQTAADKKRQRGGTSMAINDDI